MSIRSDTTSSLRSTNLLFPDLGLSNSTTTEHDLERQLAVVDEAIVPLRKAQKKLQKIEDELLNTNHLIDSNIGSKQDKAALRQTKRQLRQRRVQLWQQLEALPALLEERQELLHQIDILRRRQGMIRIL